MMDLGPQFHGTTADLHPGDRVLPRAELKGVQSNYPGLTTVDGKSTDEVAFSTTSEGHAWNFAERSVNLDKRASVLRVHPHEEQREGIFHENHIGPGAAIPGETVAPHFDVAERHDIKFGHQGTFPSLNWNQFGKPGKRHIGDALNHPTDEHIEKGHPGGALNRSHLLSGLEDLMDEPDEELASDKKQGRLW